MKKVRIPSIVDTLDEAIPGASRLDELLPDIWSVGA
jgi:hypothetical protein